MFKEWIKYNIVTYIIDENLKLFYYRKLKMKTEYFKIVYESN
jgi:hypothetical protein